MTYTIGGPNALTQHIFDGSTTPLCGQSFGDGFEALLEEKGTPPKTLESEMNRDGADAAIAVGLCENCREKYAENESGEIAEIFESVGDDRASVDPDPAADDELVTDGGTDVDAEVTHRESVPVRADEHTERSIGCSRCKVTWDLDSLYNTGDVLRCPGCDEVLAP